MIRIEIILRIRSSYGLRFEAPKEDNTDNSASPVVLPKGRPTESDLTPESSHQKTPSTK